jgi:elongation factor G
MVADSIEPIDFDLDHPGRVVLTLLAEVAGEGRHMLRSRAGPEYGHLKLLLSPFLGECAYRFEWRVVQRALPDFAKEAALEGVRIALQEELPVNRCVSRIRIAVVDGSYHDTDSSPRSFEFAAELAVRDALSRARLVKT